MTVYYLINNDAEGSFGHQIDLADQFFNISDAIRHANLRSERTGQNWSVIGIQQVYSVEK